VTTSIPGSTGTFRFSRSTRAWTWSEQLYTTFGFVPGDVVPTQDLMLSHQHPEDRAAVQQVLEDTLASGRPHSVWHRLVDAQGSTRQVVTLCAGDFAEDGTLVGVSGFLIDLTEPVRRTTAREVGEAIELMSQSRPVIEQAKGALMVTYGLDADDAFLLLRRYSQQVNVKLRDVARAVVEALPGRGLPHASRAVWDALAAGLAGAVADAEERTGT
jgi:hypothetical protein